MTKPAIILDPHWRTTAELFSQGALSALHEEFDVIWGRDEPISREAFDAAWPSASALISATPTITERMLGAAPKLRAVIEVSGAFPDTIDYGACAAKGVEVLSCAPGFRESVAEMGLAMALAGARGLVAEHEAFRNGSEGWLQENPATDFSLHGARIGFVGFGQIARELTRLLAPFRPRIRAQDPWLAQEDVDRFDVELCGLADLLKWSRCLFVTAVPTSRNKALISADKLALLPDHALVVLLSRAHLVDFDALVAAAKAGRIRVAADVFPVEPLPQDHPVRILSDVILSPHRAAAVQGGRHLIGDMILRDLKAMWSGDSKRRLAQSDASRVELVAGVGGAARAANIAADRGAS
ncbi:MAG: hydroxyacid dehydrogenase [Boseongicola sp. SB0676_bin_33]|uniref:Hydroxyacid dehydrogenase n=1 Tax=Boseongicola sp. SB0664_bin_43 TaxID=2604844 RepID=A0A6B0Y349_9RHOB|nr:hydroxyacid dehydrogenase [Boseongicola sp. SB0664_bin_43]MYF88232.1 hydroxyacid dehydrogenase [Boseongicola sp. SB0676_bin_33]MYK32472.1 hydroxyacid dehydrogenase [Boseongicola sp. SB0670_bin_30]